ncbi:MAG TPA: hypothetical protein GXX39_05610 [Syntrophothermus lipocalidus]|nr:hypothetical protein [Syntrophothermus lipocalidus]
MRDRHWAWKAASQVVAEILQQLPVPLKQKIQAEHVHLPPLELLMNRCLISLAL